MNELSQIFGFDIKLIELGVAFVGTVASSIIACIAVYLTIAHNTGPKPILVLASRGLQAKDSPQGFYVLEIEYEFWNRRTYPIWIDGTDLSFKNSFLRSAPLEYDFGQWSAAASRLSIRDFRETVQPGAFYRFRAKAPIRAQKVSTLSEPFEVDVRFFDPRKNKRLRLVRKSVLAFSVDPKPTVRDRLINAFTRIWPLTRWRPADRNRYDHFDVGRGIPLNGLSGAELAPIVDDIFLAEANKPRGRVGL